MKQLNTDVAIVAAGPAGLAAAITAAERGAKVIVLEKSATTGGTANMGMGPFAVDSKLQKMKNVSLSKEEAFKIWMEYTHWRVDARLVSDYINKTASTIDWLEDIGIQWYDVIAYVKGAYFTHHLVKPSSGTRPGPQAASTMNKIMTEYAADLGVKFYLETPAKKLIKEDGRITGVIAEDKAKEEIEIKAQAVILATGGFGDNSEMVKKFTGYELGSDLFSFRGPGLVGDGIRMANEAGAGMEGMNIELTCSTHTAPSTDPGETIMIDPVVSSAFSQPNLLVNVQGERFMNEEASGNPTYTGNAVTRQKDRLAWCIFDAATAKHYEEVGFDWINYMIPVSKVKNFNAEFKKAYANRKDVFSADSLEELADKAEIDLTGLRKTINEYNKACETGRDDIFHKNSSYLRSVKQPPYYANKFVLSGYGTLGGIKINYKTEVVTANMDTIPGLYAAGTDANSIYADSYIFIFPGNSMGFALNSGRIAGENAAEYVKKASA
ncbi:MAG: FAD-dependent oxidoreductase [Dehalococcoidales bacterium]|nr:FAD-dependent oxidoreductase [Dehalococcoidales bacterium]